MQVWSRLLDCGNANSWHSKALSLATLAERQAFTRATMTGGNSTSRTSGFCLKEVCVSETLLIMSFINCPNCILGCPNDGFNAQIFDHAACDGSFGDFLQPSFRIPRSMFVLLTSNPQREVG